MALEDAWGFLKIKEDKQKGPPVGSEQHDNMLDAETMEKIRGHLQNDLKYIAGYHNDHKKMGTPESNQLHKYPTISDLNNMMEMMMHRANMRMDALQGGAYEHPIHDSDDWFNEQGMHIGDEGGPEKLRNAALVHSSPAEYSTCTECMRGYCHYGHPESGENPIFGHEGTEQAMKERLSGQWEDRAQYNQDDIDPSGLRRRD